MGGGGWGVGWPIDRSTEVWYGRVGFYAWRDSLVKECQERFFLFLICATSHGKRYQCSLQYLATTGAMLRAVGGGGGGGGGGGVLVRWMFDASDVSSRSIPFRPLYHEKRKYFPLIE